MSWSQNAIALNDRWGLGASRKGPVVAVFGASGVGGADTGQYGAHTVSTALAPGITSRKNGVAQTDFTGVVGLEAGLAWRLSLAGRTGITVVSRAVNTTTCALWVSTHFATIVADMSGLGLVPSVCVYLTAALDCATLAAAQGFYSDLRQLQVKIDNAWPGCGFVLFGPNTTAPTDLAIPEATEVSRAHASDRTGQRQFLATSGVALQADLTHPTAAGYDELGLRAANAILQGGCLG